jgi:hypothetical protein
MIAKVLDITQQAVFGVIKGQNQLLLSPETFFCFLGDKICEKASCYYWFYSRLF